MNAKDFGDALGVDTIQDIITSTQPVFIETEKNKTNTERENLVKKAIKGDSEAFSELLSLITPEILYSTRYILRNQMDAEDAAQEIMIRVCSNIRELRDTKKFKAWLNSIVMNETRRFMRDNYKRDAGADIDDYLNDIEEKKVDHLPHESAEKSERDRTIMQVVDKLPTNQRLAILFHYYKGFSITETAGMMGVKQQSVSRSLKLAREKIKDELTSRDYPGTSMAGGFAMLGLGKYLKGALQAESDVFVAENAGWITKTIETSTTLYNSAEIAAAAGTVGTPAFVAGIAIKPIIATVAALATTAAIVTGVYTYNSDAARRREENETVSVAQGEDIECEITFIGGSSDGDHINPVDVIVWASGSEGELTAESWWITVAYNEQILFRGEGRSEDGIFEFMAENGMDGRYTLNYSMIDASGGTYRVYRDFTISTLGNSEFGIRNSE